MASAPDDPALDVALVRDALAKNEPAMLALAERLRCIPRILAALNARLGHPLGTHDLDDTVQDTWLVLHSKLAQFRGEVALEGWVFRFCRYELMNAIRRRRRLPKGDEGDERRDESADREWRRIADRDALEAALDRIGGVEADALRMKHFEGLTFEEMAVCLHISTTAVKGRYYRALGRLEAIVAEQKRREDGLGTNL